MAIIGLLGIAAAVIGAIGGGWLSDKLGRRKLFVGIGAGLFAAGAIVEATAYSVPTLIVGAVLMNLALAAFGAVDQAIVMAILPDRSEAGRYMAVVQFAQKIPSAFAPILAAAIITIGAAEGVKNYTLGNAEPLVDSFPYPARQAGCFMMVSNSMGVNFPSLR
ncbi:hypothetical protein BOH66_14925 [Microbacterium aurum]|uniref:Major facilitator superfamily (MFS) profile domain-containing protein n=1 Tax=Microbacterium aurum TaxID=36805 RepID=A0A1P8UBA8_9MICO|nr:MFS transporter [Microbacterium aurum]APZ35393.1 hypothetical protein BOH66_14925 [Microbacterium aurum]MBM7826052.1 MFS family permease [Microbacterium aurum]